MWGPLVEALYSSPRKTTWRNTVAQPDAQTHALYRRVTQINVKTQSNYIGWLVEEFLQSGHVAPQSTPIDSSEKAITILGDRGWTQTTKQEGGKIGEKFLRNIWGKNVLSAQKLKGSLLGVGTVLCLERDACSIVKILRQATNEYPPKKYRSTVRWRKLADACRGRKTAIFCF